MDHGIELLASTSAPSAPRISCTAAELSALKDRGLIIDIGADLVWDARQLNWVELEVVS